MPIINVTFTHTTRAHVCSYRIRLVNAMLFLYLQICMRLTLRFGVYLNV